MDEHWKEIPGFGGHYEVSTLGHIRVKDRMVIKRHRTGKPMQQFYPGRILSPSKADKWGHLSVKLCPGPGFCCGGSPVGPLSLHWALPRRHGGLPQ